MSCVQLQSKSRSCTSFFMDSAYIRWQVEDETPGTYACMVVMDGNNSLKRFAPIGNRAVGDT